MGQRGVSCWGARRRPRQRCHLGRAVGHAALVGAGKSTHAWQRVLAGQLEVVVHIFELLEVVLLQDDESLEVRIVTPGTVEAVDHMLFLL